MLMVGMMPVSDALGRVNKLEIIPLEELGRPRVDVVVNSSGVFRDLFVNQMNLLDRAVKLAAEQDEPLEMNFVRKHALEVAEEQNISLREASTRVFSNSSGSYSAASFTARSRRFIWLTKRSRNTPEQFTTTSTRGRPSSSRGIISSLFTRPRASDTGITPTISMTWARDSP